MKILIEHGQGPATALVGKRVQVEVELTDDIQAALDAGIIRQVEPPERLRGPVKAPAKAKAKKTSKSAKAATPVHGALLSEEPASVDPGGSGGPWIAEEEWESGV